MITKECLICKKSFLVKETHARRGWGKFCSKKCQGKSQFNGSWRSCDICGKKIYRTPRDLRKSKSKKFFCSLNCHCIWENTNIRAGKNSPNWIAGHSVYRDIIARINKPKKCTDCGNNDHRVLVVHHRDSNRSNNDTDNLEWLCMNCHGIKHHKTTDPMVAIV